VLIIRQLGDCKLELEFEVIDFEQYSEIVEDLKDKFPRPNRNCRYKATNL
jgi:hypothetical protein